MNKNYCDKLTEEILNWLPPMHVIQFKTGKTALAKWAKKTGYDVTYSYCPRKKQHMAYYKERK